MRTLVASNDVIILGKQGENLAAQVLFPVVAEWKALYGEGAFQLLYQRPGEETSYACVISTDDENVIWGITATEVANVGNGRCELQYFVGAAIAKSMTYVTRVAKSVADEGATPPEPWEAWVEEVLQAGADAQQAAEQAEQSAKDIEDLTVEAESVASDQPARVEKTHPEGRPYNLKFFLPRGEQGEQGEKGEQGETGQTGATGNGISKIELISTSGLAKTYRITYTNGNHFDFVVTDGETPIIDPVPVEGSPNAVASGGVYAESAKKYEKPPEGIPKTDLEQHVRDILDQAERDNGTLQDHVGNTGIHVTESEKRTWNAKYKKPDGGIPKSDLSSAVQATLSNAESDHEAIPTLALTSESGYSISFSVDTSTYVLTAQLLNKAGTVLSTQTVDLPLESVVVSGSYDDTTKKVTLTLVNGSTVEFSIADLISGLVSTETFTAHTGDTTVHITAAERATWNNKANQKGVYDEMTVGTAKQILATVGVVEKAPYNSRTSAGAHDIGSNRETDKIIGGTVKWNQAVHNGNFASSDGWSSKGGILTIANNIAVFDTWNGSGNRIYGTVDTIPANHVCILSTMFRLQSGNASAIRFGINDSENLEGGTGSLLFTTSTIATAANKWIPLQGIWKTTKECTSLVLGTLSSIERHIFWNFAKVNVIDITKLFGSTIADYVYSLETTHEGDGVAWFRNLFPKAYYSYNARQLMSVKTSSHDMVGFNAYNHATGTAILLGGQEWQITGDYTALSYVDINGDSETITPDANGKFTPTNNGTLTVTGGNDTDTCVHLVWSGAHDNEYKPYVKYSYALDPNLDLRGFPKLATDNSLYYDGDEYEGSGQVTRKYGVRAYAEGDENDPDVMTDGTNTLYALTTPTTESAAPFANPQIVDDYGTEQYVDDREVAIPVGHETLYQADLRDKLQHLPSLYSVNGVVQSGRFHIQQDGTNMVLVPDTSDARLDALETGKQDKLAQSTNLTPTTQTVTLAKNTRYAFGTLTDLSITFPATADDGDEIVIEFVSGSTATTLTLDNTNAIYNFSSINADKFVELNAQYKVSVGKWVVYSAETDYTV